MTSKEARELLKQAYDRYSHGRNKRHDEYLRNLAKQQMAHVPSLYSTRKAKGWDVMVDSLVSTSPGGSSGR